MKISTGALFLAIALCGPNISLATETDVQTISTPQADLIVVHKSARQLILMNDNVPLKTYDIDLGFAPEGDKLVSGDGKTPEGRYVIDRRNPNSAYHLSIGISYPNEEDLAAAQALGSDPGGDIFIHGGPTRFWDRFKQDWTAGCIAVRDQDMEEIWDMVQVGTAIVILP